MNGQPQGSDVSEESLLAGRLRCLQPRQGQGGYRFSLDAVLLARFPLRKKNERILDLCSGCGIVSLLLAFFRPDAVLTALELQPRLAALLRRNVDLNAFQERIRVVEGDCCRIASLLPAGACDLVVCNPPYRALASGRRNPAAEQAVARHEIAARLEDVVRAAAFVLKTRGRAAFVYPAVRAATLLRTLPAHALEPKRLQSVHSFPGDPGRLVLVEAVKNGGEGLTLLPPLHVYREKGGGYTPEMVDCYAGQENLESGNETE